MYKSLALDLRAVQSELRKRPLLLSSEMLGSAGDIFRVKDHGYRRIDDFTSLHLMDFKVGQSYSLTMNRRDLICIMIMLDGTYSRRAGDATERVNPAMVQITNCPESISDTETGNALRGIFVVSDRRHFVEQFQLNVDHLPASLQPIFLSAEGAPKALKVPMLASTIMATEQILSCKYQEPIKSMFINAKAVEIVCGVVSQLNSLLPQQRLLTSLPGIPVQAIEAAATIYQREMHRPPTIEQLAYRLGLNRNDLINGFKALFGETPHAYYNTLRMVRAQEMLRSGGLSISDIARRVGYERYASFSRAYQEHFGCSPSSVGRSVAD